MRKYSYQIKYNLTKHHEHEVCIFSLSKFFKWARLNSLAGRFWTAGRMFDPPPALSVMLMNYFFLFCS